MTQQQANRKKEDWDYKKRALDITTNLSIGEKDKVGSGVMDFKMPNKKQQLMAE